jgi:hypothetical protein
VGCGVLEDRVEQAADAVSRADEHSAFSLFYDRRHRSRFFSRRTPPRAPAVHGGSPASPAGASARSRSSGWRLIPRRRASNGVAVPTRIARDPDLDRSAGFRLSSARVFFGAPAAGAPGIAHGACGRRALPDADAAPRIADSTGPFARAAATAWEPAGLRLPMFDGAACLRVGRGVPGALPGRPRVPIERAMIAEARAAAGPPARPGSSPLCAYARMLLARRAPSRSAAASRSIGAHAIRHDGRAAPARGRSRAPDRLREARARAVGRWRPRARCSTSRICWPRVRESPPFARGGGAVWARRGGRDRAGPVSVRAAPRGGAGVPRDAASGARMEPCLAPRAIERIAHH